MNTCFANAVMASLTTTIACLTSFSCISLMYCLIVNTPTLVLILGKNTNILQVSSPILWVRYSSSCEWMNSSSSSTTYLLILSIFKMTCRFILTTFWVGGWSQAKLLKFLKLASSCPDLSSVQQTLQDRDIEEHPQLLGPTIHWQLRTAPCCRSTVNRRLRKRFDP